MDATAALRDRVETLEEENRQLRALRLPPETKYLGVGFSRTERIVLAALMATDAICTRDYLLDCIILSRINATPPEPKTVDVVLCRIRKALAAFGFPGVIETHWGEGWRLHAKDKLRQFFEEKMK